MYSARLMPITRVCSEWLSVSAIPRTDYLYYDPVRGNRLPVRAGIVLGRSDIPKGNP